MMITKNTEIEVLVIPYKSFIAEHGQAHLDTNIMKTYVNSTGRENVRLCSSIQKGYIFAWESPFPHDVQKDFRFALRIDFDGILKDLEAA